MREHNIRTEPLQFITIKELSVKRHINEHGTAVISGYIADENSDEYLELLSGNVWEKLEEEGEDGEVQTLFWGVVTGFSIENINEQKKMTLELTSGTFHLDLKKHFRTFQDSTYTYGQIFDQIIEKYDNSGLIKNQLLSDAIGSLVIQHKETDWEFMKRLASRYHTFLVPSFDTEGVKFFVDLPKRDTYDLQDIEKCMIKKDMGDFLRKQNSDLQEIHETAYLEYCIESRYGYQIGDRLKIDGIQLYIYRIESKYERGEMLHTYYLKFREGIYTMKTFLKHAAGCSFYAEVLQVKEDKVQVSIFDDENTDQNINIWYPYSTVYSTPDGTGWYCMPEIGDVVRFHIPTGREEEAYIISAVHLQTNSNDRKNPKHKVLKTKYQKEVRFTPDSIILTNNQGTRIELTDAAGINIISQHDVVIRAKDDLVLSSENGSLTAAGTSSVNLQQNTTSIDIEQGISFTGGELKVQ
ncbi:MAG: contractile injection system protein, VgrG/Pvc8 family [Lachnospiraceae bacterium]